MKGAFVRKIAMLKFFVISMIFCCPIFLAATDDGGGTGAFLYSGGSGARSAGLANACSSDSNDASGAYFNAALVTSVKNTELSFYYMSPFEGISYDVLSFALPVYSYGMLAFSRVELSVEGVEKISEEGIKTGDFSDKNICYMLTYGYPVTSSFSLGLSFKLLTRDFDGLNANGFGIDGGLLYDFGGVFTASLAFQNIMQPSLKIGTDLEAYPLNVRAGGALYLFERRFAIMGDILVINALSDGRDYSGGSGHAVIRAAGGAEVRIFDFAALRCGINQSGPAAGAGVTTENFTLDYAASFTQLGVIHNFGVTARFGAVPTEREKKLADEKKRLEKDKETLSQGVIAMSNAQLYLSAMNDYNKGDYETAEKKVSALMQNGTMDAAAEKLASDIRVALNRKTAGLKFDAAAAHMANGDREKGIKLIKEAEMIFPGITTAKISEYLEKGTGEIEARHYDGAKGFFARVLAVDPSNAKAAEMLGKIQDLTDMLKKK